MSDFLHQLQLFLDFHFELHFLPVIAHFDLLVQAVAALVLDLDSTIALLVNQGTALSVKGDALALVSHLNENVLVCR